MRIILVLSSLLVAVPALAQDFPAWYLRGELGGAGIHGSTGLGGASPWAGGRIGRAFGESGLFALDLGVGASSADGRFVSATGGLELRAFARQPVSLYGRLEMGFLDDRLGGCFVGGWGGGLAVRVTDTLSARGGVLLCAHCSDGAGPTIVSVGLEYRF